MEAAAALAEGKLSPKGAELLEAAARLFYEQGYPQTTTRQITNACGITPGALYNHFSSKEEILWVIVEDAYTRTAEVCEEAVRRGNGDPAAELRELVNAMTKLHTSTHQVKAIVARGERRRLPPERDEQIERIHDRIRKAFLGTIERGVEAGVIELPDVDGRPPDLWTVARSLIGFCIYPGFWYTSDQPHSPEQLADLFSSLASRMLVQGKPRRRPTSSPRRRRDAT
jgi:AcrR family transcriptional regulator